MMDLSEEPISEEEALDEFTREQDWLKDQNYLTREQREAADREERMCFATDFALDFARTYSRDQTLECEEIALAWATNEVPDEDTFDDDGWLINYDIRFELKKQYSLMIIKAVLEETLKAELSRRNDKGVMETIQTRQARNAIKREFRHYTGYADESNGVYLECHLDREDFREWFIRSKQLPLVEGCLLKKWLESFEAEAQAQNSHDEIKPPSLQDKKKRTRKTNLSLAIYAAVKKFGRKPSFDELWQYFQEDKDETKIIHDFTDTHLTWMDTRGKFQDTLKRTVENHLSRIKS